MNNAKGFLRENRLKLRKKTSRWHLDVRWSICNQFMVLDSSPPGLTMPQPLERSNKQKKGLWTPPIFSSCWWQCRWLPPLRTEQCWWMPKGQGMVVLYRPSRKVEIRDGNHSASVPPHAAAAAAVVTYHHNQMDRTPRRRRRELLVPLYGSRSIQTFREGRDVVSGLKRGGEERGRGEETP